MNPRLLLDGQLLTEKGEEATPEKNVKVSRKRKRKVSKR